MPAAAAGQNVVLRWRMGTGVTVAGTGWSVDTIVLSSFACLVPPSGDIDGDRKSEITVYRPATGEWLIRYSSTGYATSAVISGASPATCRSAATSTAMASSISPSSDRRPASGISATRRRAYGASAVFQWGLAGDVPIGADFDGDGRADLTVYRPATGEWFIRYSSTGYSIPTSRYQWGSAGDVPVAADFDGDGRTDLTVFRPATGEWFDPLLVDRVCDRSASGRYQWGLAGDVPISADFDGDGQTDLTVYRPSTGEWFIRYSSTGYAIGSASGRYQWGLVGDIPLVGGLRWRRPDGADRLPAVDRRMVDSLLVAGLQLGELRRLPVGGGGDTPLPDQLTPTTPPPAGPPAGPGVITFDGLASRPNQTPFGDYLESGYMVSPTVGNWVIQTFGRPGPAIAFNRSASDPTITQEVRVMSGGVPVTFNSVDLYSSVTPIPYTFIGMRNGSQVFFVSLTLPNTFGAFVTVQNNFPAISIDTLVIRLSNPVGPVSNPVGLDNIMLTR